MLKHTKPYKRTILFITIYPFNDDFAEKYGFEYLKGKGYSIKILNVFMLYFKKAGSRGLGHYESLEPVCGVEQIALESAKELVGALKEIQGWRIAVLVVHPFLSLMHVLKKNDVEWSSIRANVGPSMVTYKSDSNKNAWSRKGLTYCIHILRKLKRELGKLVLNILCAFGYIAPPRYCMVRSTRYKDKGYHLLNKSKDFILTNSFDHDRFLANRNSPPPVYLPSDDYYVLLANHPWAVHDYVLLNMHAYITKEEYSKIINRFLDAVEKYTNKKIFVAAYPKATADENIYNGRPFIYDTEQLVKYSSGVIGHFTGAINFVVLHHKPFCLISLKRLLLDKNFVNWGLTYSEALGTPIHYIDTEADCRMLLEKGLFTYDKKKYEEYTQKYLITETNDGRRFWEIVTTKFEGA